MLTVPWSGTPHSWASCFAPCLRTADRPITWLQRSPFRATGVSSASTSTITDSVVYAPWSGSGNPSPPFDTRRRRASSPGFLEPRYAIDFHEDAEQGGGHGGAGRRLVPEELLVHLVELRKPRQIRNVSVDL